MAIEQAIQQALLKRLSRDFDRGEHLPHTRVLADSAISLGQLPAEHKIYKIKLEGV